MRTTQPMRPTQDKRESVVEDDSLLVRWESKGYLQQISGYSQWGYKEHRPTVDKQYTPEELIGTLVPSSKGKDKTLKKLFDRNQLSTLESVREHGINLLTSLVMSTQLNSKNSCLILKVNKQRFMYCFIAELIQTCISRSFFRVTNSRAATGWITRARTR